MSDRWPGGIISKTPVIPTGPSDTGSAPGIWTMDQASYWIKQGLWPTQILRDPYFPYVTMLLSTTSTNGGQNNTFLDSSTNNFTFTNVNTPTQGSFSPYGNNWSGYFDGSGDYLSSSATTIANFGTGDFTVECWVYSLATGQLNILDFRGTGGTGDALRLGQVGTTGKFAAGWGNNDTILSSTTNVILNQWVHIAVTRSGSTARMFINGVLEATATSSTNIPDSGMIVASYRGTTAFFNGYISNVRVVKGTAVYTSNFTPPTQPLTAITNTSLLTCAYNRFRDGSTNNFTITRNGDTKTLDFSPFAPAVPYSAATNGGSLVFNGSNEATYVDSSNAALTLGTGDFTIELWIYQRVLGGAQSWVSTYGGPGSGYRFSPTNTMQFSWGDSDVLTSTATPDINQWCHVAVTRSGSTVRIFKNGVVVATGTNSTNLTGGSTQTTLGRIPTYNQWYYNGYMSDVRIVKGTAVYTADFTPPTAPLTAISGTSLLARGTNANIFDAAAANDLLTVGNAQSSTTQAKFGTTSAYFDGSGDGVYYPSNVSVSSGDFTIECWFYTGSATNQSLFSIQTNTSSGYAAVRVDFEGATSKLYMLISASGSSWAINAGSSSTVASNTWTHVAIVRNGSNFTLYINGVSVATGTSSSTLYASTASYIGCAYAGGIAQPVNGYIDDLRITNGIARYTSNFTPPTAAFPTA